MKTNSPEVGRWEKRALQAVDLREDSDDIIFEGYASVFNAPYEVFGGPDGGGYTEIVDPNAFNRTLKSNPIVGLKIEHSGLSIAKTTAGTLGLSTDDHGLKVEARLDREDPDVQRVVPKIRRGNVDQMSFAFWTVRQEWDEDKMIRRLLEVNIDRGDVSIVDEGANPATSISDLRSVLTTIQSLDFDAAMAEVRSHGSQLALVAAHEILGQLRAEISPQVQRTLTVAEAIQLKKRSADSAHRYLARSHP